MDVVEKIIKKRKRPTTTSTPRQVKAPRPKSLVGKVAHNVLSTMWPRTMAAVDFIRAHMREEALHEKKKKAKGQEEPMNKPSYNGTNGRQNGPQDGVNVKNDYTDYTISDETVYRESIEGTGVSAAPITQSAPRASKARNAPASAGALQAAASGRIAQKQQFARQEKSIADRNMRGQIDKNQEVQKQEMSAAAKQEKNMEKKPTAEQIEYVNAVFEKNLEEGTITVRGKNLQELSRETLTRYRAAAQKDKKGLMKQVSKDVMSPSRHHDTDMSRQKDLQFGMDLIDKRNKGIKLATAKLDGTANVPASSKASSIKRTVKEAASSMPTGTAKHKTRLKNMSDKALHAHIGDRNERELRELGWRHGYGKMSDHYVDRVARGKKEIEENY